MSAWREFFLPNREGPRPVHSGPQGKSEQLVQRADWTGDHCHWHCLVRLMAHLSNRLYRCGGNDCRFHGCSFNVFELI